MRSILLYIIASIMGFPLSAQSTFERIIEVPDAFGEGGQTLQVRTTASGEEVYLVQADSWCTYQGDIFYNCANFLYLDEEGNLLKHTQILLDSLQINGATNGAITWLPDSSILYTGTAIPPNGYFGLFLLKTTPAGEIDWFRTYYNEPPFYYYGRNVMATSDGNIALSAYQSSGNNDGSIVLLKLDPEGNILWKKIYGGGYKVYDIRTSEQDPFDQGYLLSGYTSYPIQNFAIKTDSLGNEIARYSTTADFESPEFIDQYYRSPMKFRTDTAVGYVLGYDYMTYLNNPFNGTNDFRHFCSGFRILDKDSMKVVQEINFNQYDHQGELSQFKILPNAQGLIILIYRTFVRVDPAVQLPYGNNSREALQIIKCDLNGNIDWQRVYIPGNTNYKYGGANLDVVLTKDAYLISSVAFDTTQTITSSSLWLLKLNEHGCLSDDNCGLTEDYWLGTDGSLFLPQQSTPLSISPNPCSEHCELGFSFLENNSTLKVINLSGQVLATYALSKGSECFDLSTDLLSNGLYWLVLDRGDGMFNFGKLFIAK
ncbi:MAG: T9SS type A sorting domain-containing protein [Chitinophagales bacterium]|nr:T9SS type A sorting domain-containing protein [Bacteroidota bacterium]